MNDKMVLDGTQLKSILAAIGMEEARDINIKEIPQQDPGQIILTAEFVDGEAEEKLLAYVNFKQGHPCHPHIRCCLFRIKDILASFGDLLV